MDLDQIMATVDRADAVQGREPSSDHLILTDFIVFNISAK